MAYKKPDVDFTSSRVTKEGRKSNLSMFMVMLGFTFFSASMWAGQEMAVKLDFKQFILALLLGGIILGAYTGALGFIGAKSGLTLDMLAHRSFGRKGSWLPSAMISFTQIGWFGVGLAMFAIPVAQVILGIEINSPQDMPFVAYVFVAIAGVLMTASAYFGIKSLTIISYIAVPLVGILGTVAMIMAAVKFGGDSTLAQKFSESIDSNATIIWGAGIVIGSFVSGGTATPNFARFSKSGKVGFWVTVVAFFLGNSLMFFFGASSSAYVSSVSKDIFDVMMKLGLFWMAVLVLGFNIWTTNDNALYSSGLGLSNIFGWSKKTMVLIAGIIGTIAAVWLYWNFCGWLNILNCTLPPIGAILIISYFMNRNEYMSDDVQIKAVNWASVIGVVLGAVVANLLKWGIPSINGMVVAVICYLIGHSLSKK